MERLQEFISKLRKKHLLNQKLSQLPAAPVRKKDVLVVSDRDWAREPTEIECRLVAHFDSS